MTIQIIVASICIICAIVIFLGKGDWLIAGYNTASKEEKEKVNVKRLRLIIGILLLIVGPGCLFLGDPSDKTPGLIYAGVVIVLTIITVVLANTWAKQK